MTRITQRSGEPLLKFIRDFKQLYTEAFPKPLADEDDIIDCFLSAINDVEMADKVREKMTFSTRLHDAIHLCRQHARRSDHRLPQGVNEKRKHAALTTEEKPASQDKLLQSIAALEKKVDQMKATPPQRAPQKPSQGN